VRPTLHDQWQQMHLHQGDVIHHRHRHLHHCHPQTTHLLHFDVLKPESLMPSFRWKNARMIATLLPSLLCDVISVVTEFMVRPFFRQLSSLLRHQFNPVMVRKGTSKRHAVGSHPQQAAGV
jgi:hypothetical protein